MVVKVRRRAGIPRFASRLRAGIPVTVVAFGTSMTAYGEFVHHVPSALRAVPGAGNVAFVNAGMRGFVTLNAAFRVKDAVASHAPDLVLIEFSHNDLTDLALNAVRPALLGVLSQLWSAVPTAEIVFVYLAQKGHAAAGPSAAMTRWEAIAEEFGIASIDCATFVEEVVRAGVATWTEGERALTRDGVHYSELAAEVVGRPFADALVALAQASDGPERGRPPILDSILTQTETYAASDLVPAGTTWVHAAPLDHENRIAEAYSGSTVLANAVPGASFRLRFEGTLLVGWASGTGELTVAGSPPFANVAFSFDQATFWRTTILAAAPEPVVGEVEITVVSGTVILGDIGVAGRFLSG